MKKIIFLSIIYIFLNVFLSASAQIGFQEVKLHSQLFNGAVVGKTVVPTGWKVNVIELTLNPESITWPNALYVTAVSPDGSVSMKYISQRKFQQQYIYGFGITSQSVDDGYDNSNMLHTLNYRNAGDTCDFMVHVIYPDTYNTFISETPLSYEDRDALNAYWQLYDSQLRSVFGEYGGQFNFKGTEVSLAERVYQSGQNRTVVSAVVSGFEIVSYITADSYTDYINWDMNAVYAMQAPAAMFDQYRAIFDVFRLNTYTSREYAAMTDMHSTVLYNYMMSLKKGPSIPEAQLEKSLNDATNQTVDTGDTYNLTDGWSDVIKDQNDYTTSSGSHVKLSTSFDHVYEGDDGTLYAGFGSYYPEGTTELFPTSVNVR